MKKLIWITFFLLYFGCGNKLNSDFSLGGDRDSDRVGDPSGAGDSTSTTASDGDNGSEDGDNDSDGDPGVETDSETYNNVDIDPNGTYQFKSVRTGTGGGFIVNVLFHPTEPNLIYAKTDMGGVYRWVPETETWKQLLYFVSSDDWNWTGPESVAMDPSDPDKLYIAAGTYTNDWASTNGVIWRSNDQGASFQKTNMPFKMGGNMPGRGMGERLAVDPNQGNILYFGARDGYGLWKSTDSGETWSRVADFPETGPYMEDPDCAWNYANHPVGIVWVTFDPDSGLPGSPTQTIYVGTAQNEPGMPNIFRTLDGGVSWEALPGQPVSSVEGTVVTMTGGTTWGMTTTGDDGSLAYATTGLLPKQGKLDSEGTLYITYSNWAGPYQGNVGDVWKYQPEGDVWTKITPVAPADAWWGYGGLGVDMQHRGTLVVAGVNSWWPDGVIFRTTDGGTTWRPIWEWAGYPAMNQYFEFDISDALWLYNPNSNLQEPEQIVKVGWMMEGLNIDPFNSNRMMYGTGATLYECRNLSNWDSGGIITLESKGYGIEETSVLGLVSPPAGASLVSVVGDVGGWVHTDLDVAPQVSHTIPDGGTHTGVDFAENAPDTMVRVGAGFAITYDGGDTWSRSWDTLPGEFGQVAINADATSILWAPENGPVSYSLYNGGNSWTASTGIPAGVSIASDRANASTFYGFSDGTFYVSTDRGASFTASDAAGFPSFARLKAVFGQEGHVWLAGPDTDTGGLWYSTDSGATFKKVAEVTTADVVGFGMVAPSGDYPAVFISGTVNDVHEVFRSDDMGVSWNRVTDDTHKFATIQCITGDPRVYGRVYLGTNGFGILYGDML